MATRAYKYICDHIIDPDFGGVYWSVDYKGVPLDTKKQVYAIAFTIYAFSEFYVASGNEAAKEKAIEFFYLLVERAYDPINTGYFEAFTKEWKAIDDLRLSAKDENEKKTMNTHLHVLEGYTNLFRIWPDKALKEHIEILINNFFDHFIDHQTHHLQLFFDEGWNSKSDLVSYGHDIEATWLLLEAAEVIRNEDLVEKVKAISIPIAEATINGVDNDGGLWYEYEPATRYLIKEKHWWVQAEAMVGFYNAWQISGDEKYLELSIKNWGFVKDKILDEANGEWFWGINQNGQVMPGEDKAGIWKCPYHNTRACIEIIKRIDHLSEL
jgi:mannobiose 2-epimerase